jgi:PAS domain S-box-containing protein
MYDRFFKLHPDPMWIYDLESLRFLDVNEAAVAAYGYTRDEFLQMTIRDIRPPEDVAALIENVGQTPEGVEQAGVWRHRPKNGNTIFVDIRSGRIVHEGRDAKLVSARDVTERVMLEEQNKGLLESERTARRRAEEASYLLRIAGQVAQLGGWVLNLPEGTVHWSDVTAAIHRKPAGTRPTVEEGLSYYVPEHRNRIQMALSRCVEEGVPFDESLQILTAGDQKLWVRAIGEAVRNSEGVVIGVHGAFQDISELVLAREESRRLEQRLRETLDGIGEAFLIVDRVWRITYANQQAARLVERDVTQLIGQSLFDAFPEVRGSVFETKYRDAIETNTAVSFVEYFPPLEKWFEVNASPSAERLAIYFRDVTETRAQQERLLLLQTAVSRLNDIVLITEAEPIGEPGPRIVYVNEAFERRTGYNRAEAIGRSPRFLQGPLTQRDELDRIRAALESWQPVRAELINYTKSGDPFWLELEIVPIADATGWYTHWVSVERDITDRKRTDAELALSEERFRLVGQAASEAIWDWDLLRRTLWWSDGMQALFGHDPQKLKPGSESWSENIHVDDRSRVVAGIQAAIYGDAQQWTDEYRFVRANGQVADVVDRGFVIRDAEGKPVRMVGSMVDVTERRRMEGQLRQTQRLDVLGQLTGGVAHDFNNLLTVILGNSAVLEEKLAEDENLGILAQLTRKAADRAAALTSRLLAFSRRQTLDPKPTDVNRLLAGMDPLVRRTLGGEIEIELMLAPGLWTSLIDAGQLENAILNLCINARDAMSSGGKLVIETNNTHLDADYATQHPDVVPGAYAMVAISDTGTGMDTETLTRAFEPFFTTKDVGKGSGLGLSMVYGFVKQSRGHVKIYTEVGLGTTIKLYLPRSADAPREDSPALAKDQLPRGGEKILLVEDDDMVREHATAQLQVLGYKVVAVRNGAAAVQALQGIADFDLLFTDVVMPGGINGPQLAVQAKKIRPDLPVLFTSGYTENAIMHHGRLDAGVQLLNKPYRVEELARKVRLVLDDSKRSKQ